MFCFPDLDLVRSEASCLEDWDAMTSLLLGDGDLAADQHLAIAFLAEVQLKCARLAGLLRKICLKDDGTNLEEAH